MGSLSETLFIKTVRGGLMNIESLTQSDGSPQDDNTRKIISNTKSRQFMSKWGSCFYIKILF